MMGGGLFNTSLMGAGWVAILSDGPPVLLNTGDAPTYADPQAAITWASSVQTSVKTDVKLKNLSAAAPASRCRWRSPGRLGARAAERGPRGAHRAGRQQRRWGTARAARRVGAPPSAAGALARRAPQPYFSW